MALNYPKGTSLSYHEKCQKKNQKVNSNKKIEFGKRGMSFEEEINRSNEYYLNRNIAVIHKKPTPIQIVKVDYPRRSAAVIKEAYFRQASTTDYNGVYQGYYIDFEAKETKNKQSFPMANFHEHQIKHMESCLQQKGITFILLWFSSLNRCFLVGAEMLIEWWENQKNGGKKSIPLVSIEQKGIEIKLGIAPTVPYLEAVDEYMKRRFN